MSNDSIKGEESRPDTTPVYAYALRSEIDGKEFFLCNHPTAFTIANLPARFVTASNPQEFTPAQINHGSVQRSDGFEAQSFDVTARIASVQQYSRFIMFAMIPRLEVNVIKVVAGAAEGGAAEWGVDAMIVQNGLVENFSFEAHEISVRCTPEPFLNSQVVPRWRFTRTCNRKLYGADCGVDRTSFQHSNAITALDIDLRQVTISGQKAGSSDDYFNNGVITHTPTGVKTSILDHQNVGGNTVVTLQSWIPELSVTDNVVLNAGCRHNFEDCDLKFSNSANFGGFRSVPSLNPALHGVKQAGGANAYAPGFGRGTSEVINGS